MQRTRMMYLQWSRGAAAALVGIASLSMTAAAGAQVVRARDTIFVRTLEPGKIDSIRTLMRKLDQQQPGSEEFTVITRRMDELMGATVAGVMKGQLRMRGPNFSEAATPKGYVGLNVQGPRQIFFDSTGQRLTYLAYPAIVSVEPESPAGRAGIVPGDVLLAYDGIDVVGHEFNMTKLLVPDRKLDVAVRHEGDRKDYTLVVAKLPERMAVRIAMTEGTGARAGHVEVRPSQGVITVPRAEGGRARLPMLPGGVWIISPSGVLGANMSAVGPELAKTLHLATGVLVNEVPETSPAYASGLRVGDVVVSIAGKPVTSMEDLHAVFMQYMPTHEAPFRVVREKKSRDITVRW